MLNTTRETKMDINKIEMNVYEIGLDANSLCIENILKGYETYDIDALTMTIVANNANEAKERYINCSKDWDNIIIYKSELVATLMN